jgi:hypothetical protein
LRSGAEKWYVSRDGKIKRATSSAVVFRFFNGLGWADQLYMTNLNKIVWFEMDDCDLLLSETALKYYSRKSESLLYTNVEDIFYDFTFLKLMKKATHICIC